MKISLKRIFVLSFLLILLTIFLVVLLVVLRQKGTISEQLIVSSENDLISDITNHLDHFFDIPELTIEIGRASCRERV